MIEKVSVSLYFTQFWLCIFNVYSFANYTHFTSMLKEQGDVCVRKKFVNESQQTTEKSVDLFLTKFSIYKIEEWDFSIKNYCKGSEEAVQKVDLNNSPKL